MTRSLPSLIYHIYFLVFWLSLVDGFLDYLVNQFGELNQNTVFQIPIKHSLPKTTLQNKKKFEN